MQIINQHVIHGPVEITGRATRVMKRDQYKTTGSGLPSNDLYLTVTGIDEKSDMAEVAIP